MLFTACGGTPATATEAAPAPTEKVVEAAPTTPPTEPPAPTAAPVEKVTLTIWHNWGPDDAKGPAMKTIFDEFRAANPDIILVDEVYVDADIPLKVETASAAKQEPDLVFTGRIGSAYTWTDSGISIPVEDLISEWGFDGKFLDAAISQFTQADGKVQAFPLEGYTWPVWYNTKVFEAAGVAIPTTTDELIAAAKVIRAAGFGGPMVVSGADGMGSYVFTLVLQTLLSDAEAEQCMGKGDWTAPNCIKAVELFVQLRDAGVFVDNVEGIDYPSAETQFGTGKVAMCHYGAWAFADPDMLPLNPDVKLGGFPLPAGSPHKLPVFYSAFTAKGIFITPNGAAKLDAVKKFIQFFYQPEMIARLVEQAGMTPPLKDVPVDASKINMLFAQSLNMPAEVAETPDMYMPPEVSSVLGPLTQKAFTPGVTTEEILAELVAAYAAVP
jgi:multiple sugar transport system substrate-binding protein